MITIYNHRRDRLNLTEEDRFEWTHMADEDEMFIVERVELIQETDRGQEIALHGPWVKTPERLAGLNNHLSVMGWDNLYIESIEQHAQRAADLPDEVLVQLGVFGLKLDLLRL